MNEVLTKGKEMTKQQIELPSSGFSMKAKLPKNLRIRRVARWVICHTNRTTL